MHLINGTKFAFGANQATDAGGTNYLLAVLKATYSIPEFQLGVPAVSESPVPLLDADSFWGEPGLSAPKFESDWAFRKQQCDVVLHANAHAPEGEAVTELEVGFSVGQLSKRARVVGPRRWQSSSQNSPLRLTAPEPFTEMPLSYEQSFGGTWYDPEREAYEFFARNPVGCGFAKTFRWRLDGQPAPTIEPIGEPIKHPDGNYRPYGFGPLGRNWSPRAELAGTYDDAWQAERFPLLPADFDERYHQCVAPDQQTEFLHGGESVVLENLHPTRPLIKFNLPNRLSMPMLVITDQQTQRELIPVADTLIIDVPNETFSIVWRGQLPLKRSLREIKMLAVGHVCRQWWKAQLFGASDCGCGGLESDPDKVISIGEAIAG